MCRTGSAEEYEADVQNPRVQATKRAEVWGRTRRQGGMSHLAGHWPPARAIECIRAERHVELDKRQYARRGRRRAVTCGQERTLVNKRRGTAPEESLGKSGIVRFGPHEECADIREQIEEVDHSERMKLRRSGSGVPDYARRLSAQHLSSKQCHERQRQYHERRPSVPRPISPSRSSVPGNTRREHTSGIG